MGKFCIHCAKKGMKMKLKPYLINFEEAVLFCTNEECNNTDGFRVVKLQQLVFKPKQKKLKVGITHAGKTLENQNDNVEFQYEIKSTENVVLKSVDTELDDILFGLTNNNNDPVTLDNDDLDLLGFGNINLSQPVEKTTEEVVNPNNLEDLGLGNNPSLNSTIQPVEKDSKEAFKADDLNFLTFDNVALFNTPSAEVEKASDECFKYPLWKNENNLCWLHAMMCVFVHNNSIRNYVFGSMRNSCLNKLILGYDECVALLNSEGTNPELISETLKSLRDQLFTLLKPKMKRNLGDCDNPWFVLWALVSKEKIFNSLFDFKHRWETVCESCGHKKVEKKRKSLQTLTKITDSFLLPNNLSTNAVCVKCKKERQSRCLKFEEFPSVLALQFEQGFPLQNDISSCDFNTGDGFYKVSAIIQYKRNPDHFVTWIRDISSEKLLCCDDLKGLPVSFKRSNVNFNSSEIHIVFWDKMKPILSNDNIMTQCSSLTSSLVNERAAKPLLNCDSNMARDSWVNEDISLNNWDCNSSSYSNHSNSTAPFNDLCATTVSSLKSFASTNDSLATQPSHKHCKLMDQRAKSEMGRNSESTEFSGRKRPSSSISDMSNASDGDLSIVSVLESGKFQGYKGYRPKTLQMIPKSKPKIVKSPKRPKLDKGKTKRSKSAQEESEKCKSSPLNSIPKPCKREGSSALGSVKDTISNLLNDTNFFAS